MNDLSLFYGELVLAWEKFSVCKNLTGSQISTQSLWNNKFIHSKSKSLYDDSLVSKGVIYVIMPRYAQVLRRNNIKIPFLTWWSSCSSRVTQNAIAHV